MPGFSKMNAHKTTKLAYTAVHDASCAGTSRKLGTLLRLMRWSFKALEDHWCYLSVARTLGLNEDEELRNELAKVAARLSDRKRRAGTKAKTKSRTTKSRAA